MKAIRSICLMLISVLLALGGTSQALADECVANEKQIAGQSIGSRCKEDPACVVVGGTHMLEWRSPAPAKIVVVCIHGLGLCARAYKPLAQELSAAGIDGFGVNVRGFGPDRDKPDRARLNCIETVDDVSTLLAGIHREHPDYRVILMGESMGGALTVRIAAEHPELVDAVVCSAPAWKILKMRRTAVKGVFEIFLSPGNRPGPAGRAIIHQATSDPRLTEHWLTDPSHKLKLSWGEATAFLNFISKTDSYAKQLTKPVLVVQGLNDHLVSPTAVAKMFRNIPCNNKTFLIDGTGEHLILEEARFTPAITEKLIAWIKSESSASISSSALEVIDDDKLSVKEQRNLSRLCRLANLRYQVKWAGALRNVHQGLDFSGTIAMPPLQHLPYLYAVGPLEDLKGEITIWNGKPLISRIINDKLEVDNVFSGKACFLVYGQVYSWKTVKLRASLTMSKFDDLVKEEAIKCGIDTDRPFPFLIDGKAAYAKYHVLNRTESGPPEPRSGSHDKDKVHFTLNDTPVQLLGFYSEHHQGIFTHNNSFVHIHIKTPDDRIAGHLEDVEISPGAKLFLPSR